ncbi:unnamed protein product [Caenorhabditis sp. 36 PRJEB53466]|nr:unnamed protein product [Caenorhabditis sp. 36 PRJEB53466]
MPNIISRIWNAVRRCVRPSLTQPFTSEDPAYQPIIRELYRPTTSDSISRSVSLSVDSQGSLPSDEELKEYEELRRGFHRPMEICSMESTDSGYVSSD